MRHVLTACCLILLWAAPAQAIIVEAGDAQAALATAQPGGGLPQKALGAYHAGDYTAAAERYAELAALAGPEGPSPALAANAGLAALRAHLEGGKGEQTGGRLAQAVYWLTRAALADPSDPSIRLLAARARAAVGEGARENETLAARVSPNLLPRPLAEIAATPLSVFRPGALRWTLLLANLCCWFCLGGLILRGRCLRQGIAARLLGRRRLVAGLLVSGLLLLALGPGLLENELERSAWAHGRRGVAGGALSVRSAPELGEAVAGAELFRLAEGAEVRILETRGASLRVDAGEAGVGYVPRDALIY